MYSVFEKLLKSSGMTVYRFCKETGVSESTIYTWKNKNTKCGTKLAEIISNYFGISIDYLMTGKEPAEADDKTSITEKEKRYMAYAIDLMNKGVSLEKLKKLVDAADGGLNED